MARFSLDPKNLPRLTPAERRRLERMTDAEITAAANEDADNKPLTREELGKICSARLVRQARRPPAWTKQHSPRPVHQHGAVVRDLEQGRIQADCALLVYLRVVERDSEAVRRALDW